jgi:hypothetical protein
MDRLPIRLRDVLTALDAHTPGGQPIPFDITFVTFSRSKRTGGEVITLRNVIRARHARNLSRAQRREFVPAQRRDIPVRAMRSDIIRLYNPQNGLIRNCYQRFIVAFNDRPVSY